MALSTSKVNSAPTLSSVSLIDSIVRPRTSTNTKPVVVQDPIEKPRLAYTYGIENEQLLEMLGLNKKKKKSGFYDFKDQYGLSPEADQAKLSENGYMDINQLLAMKRY